MIRISLERHWSGGEGADDSVCTISPLHYHPYFPLVHLIGHIKSDTLSFNGNIK